ncbi:pilus assembly protein [Altererythrobacter arenosus]|uniref:Pilus assembly protein n=1 Tax=Altererythrobacter arenosus TaxID=3032592 RepID=A0ABY8FQE3_9SPHN|nr:TadE/TadG family type IV pilus assembly protein [Altererythrobacter sp. CAU 1644]WFL76465.1 pilus assembly protein [Altererythrobacter sp. CAU 1644]
MRGADAMIARARHLLRRIWREDSGVAFIEFAYAAPVFLVLILVGIETANLALAHLRVSHLAMTVADNAGRTTSGVDEAHVYEVFAGAGVIGSGIEFEENGRLVLSSLEHNGRNGGNEGQTIVWQRCWGDLDIDPAYGVQGDGADDDSLPDGLGEPGNQIMALPDTAVMFVEATYDYQPIVGTGWFTPPQIRYESAFNVRGRMNNNITNTQSLTQLTCD